MTTAAVGAVSTASYLTPDQEQAERRALANAEIYGKPIAKIVNEATQVETVRRGAATPSASR